MTGKRWLRPLVGAASVVSGVVGGFVLAFAGWALLVDQDPSSEAGGLGLIWVLCLFTVPLMVLAIRSVLFRLLGPRR